MPYVECQICSSKFYVKPYHQQKGWGKYCSKTCQNVSQVRGQEFPCEICLKTVWRTQRDFKHSLSKKFFCSKSCQTKWRNIHFSGPLSLGWKTGIYAYRKILLRQDIAVLCVLCGTKDKRILAVHHVDKNRHNNDPGNLSWLCYNCHFLVHHYVEEMQRFMDLRKT